MSESTVDEKKEENINKDMLTSVLSIFKLLLAFGVTIIIGTLTLYSVRASQTGLIPTNTDFNPYTNINGVLKNINVNINVVKKENEIFSSKINFPAGENLLQMKKGLLGFLENLIYGEKSSTVSLYLGKILEKVIAVNFWLMNMVYNILNTYCPESLIIFIGPIVMFFVQFTSVFVNMVSLVYQYFYNIYLLFSKKTQENGKTKWEENSIFDILNVGWSCFYYFVFFVLFCFCGFFIVPTIAFIISIYCLFFPLFLESNIVKESSGNFSKKYGLKQAILDTFTFKKSIIMYVLTILLISKISTVFSSYVLVGTILGFLILYFFTDIYKQYIPKSSDFVTAGLASFEPVVIQ